jgi:hypothetical protein
MTDPTEQTVREDAEVTAIRRIAAILAELDIAAQDRIAGWVYDRYRQPPEELPG